MISSVARGLIDLGKKCYHIGIRKVRLDGLVIKSV